MPKTSDPRRARNLRSERWAGGPPSPRFESDRARRGGDRRPPLERAIGRARTGLALVRCRFGKAGQVPQIPFAARRRSKRVSRRRFASETNQQGVRLTGCAASVLLEPSNAGRRDGKWSGEGAWSRVQGAPYLPLPAGANSDIGLWPTPKMPTRMCHDGPHNPFSQADVRRGDEIGDELRE